MSWKDLLMHCNLMVYRQLYILLHVYTCMHECLILYIRIHACPSIVCFLCVASYNYVVL